MPTPVILKTHLGPAQVHLFELGGEHALHGRLHLVDGVIDDPVHAHIHVHAGGRLLGVGVGADIEAHDDSAGGGGQHHVALADGAHGAVDDPDPDLLVGQLLQAGLHGLGRALHVGLDDDVQLLHLALLDGIEQVVERYLVEQLVALFLLLVLALLDQLARHLLVVYGVEDVACARNLGQTDDLDRNRRACLLDLLAVIVGHRADAANRGARDNGIACVQGAVLNEQGSDRAAALVETRFDNSTLCKTVGISLEFLYLSNEKNVFEQLVDPFACLCGNGNADNVTAPVLANEVVLGEFFLDPVGVSAFLIHFVDSNNNGNSCCLCMVYGFNGLRHDTVISRNNEDSDIRDIRTSCTH